ncbi:hypothetical protein KAR91_38060 [Candidatus Pacearchaeota archaeon]|nr:hypothetical protein [Candidatus Pacearchaeota archaeon]
MAKKEFRQKIKSELKTWAKQIHDLKSSRKEGKRDGRSLDSICGDIMRLKHLFRYQHIAYCMFFNHRTMEQIENSKSLIYEKPWMKKIEEMIEVWEGKVNEEAICDSAA